MILTEQQLQAIRLLGVFTGGSFRVGNLSGPHAVGYRANLMEKLKGVKIPKAKCGLTSLRDTFYALADLPESCEAVREDNFIKWAKEILALHGRSL